MGIVVGFSIQFKNRSKNVPLDIYLQRIGDLVFYIYFYTIMLMLLIIRMFHCNIDVLNKEEIMAIFEQIQSQQLYEAIHLIAKILAEAYIEEKNKLEKHSSVVPDNDTAIYLQQNEISYQLQHHHLML